MYLFLIAGIITVVAILIAGFAAPDYRRGREMVGWGLLIGILTTVFAFVISLFLTEVESMYTKTVTETELLPTGPGLYVLESNGDATWRTENGPQSNPSGRVTIVPDDDPRVERTEWDTNSWALLPKDPEYVLYVPSGGTEGLTDSD
jgi:hypothetical protein